MDRIIVEAAVTIENKNSNSVKSTEINGVSLYSRGNNSSSCDNKEFR